MRSKSNKKRLSTILIVVISVTLFVAIIVVYAYFTDFSEPSVGVLKDLDTGEKTPYSMEILSYDGIENDYVRSWIDDKRTKGTIDGKPVYYTLYNDNYEAPIEMYLFMPMAKDILGDISVSDILVSLNGDAILLNVEVKENISRDRLSDETILHLYATDASSDEAKAKTERLFINGERYGSPGSTFIRF